MARAAVVTGAASGIGRAIAARLERDGARVLAVDLEPDPDGPGEPFAADLTTRAGNRDAVAAAIDRFGGLDTVVPNAGFQHVAPVEEFPEDRWDAMIALLLTSPFLLARAAWPAPFKSAYVAAKHGVLGLVKTLALEGADDGVVATAVCPGYVRTRLVENQVAAQAQAHGMPEDRVLEEVILAPHAVKRLIEPDEVAEVVAFLLSPAGRSFTGAAVTMDQGWSAR
jgi:3-hydroxybutyrate dehydrogenase